MYFLWTDTHVVFSSILFALIVCFKILHEYRYNTENKRVLMGLGILAILVTMWIVFKMFFQTFSGDPFWIIIALPIPIGFFFGLILYKLAYNKQTRKMKRRLRRLYRRKILKLPY
ncbi:hypothetical protein COB64_03190 [Candidatus Wolfebacteria bacterium]|nr:MAG: hypothetical protein COB64_03190 [Candidatus Wolfebacteria bacterium]